MTQTIWIARHGNRLDFVNPEWFNTAQRKYDPPLSDDGIIQARKLGQRLKSEKINHIIASPFLRTIQTANEVAKILDLSIKIEAGLGEWLNPDWMENNPQIHSPEELKIAYPRIDWSYRSQLTPQYPEDELQLYSRCQKTAEILIKEFSQDILIVGHSLSVIGITKALVGKNAQINASLCCLVKIVKNKNKWELKLNGDISHLKSN